MKHRRTRIAAGVAAALFTIVLGAAVTPRGSHEPLPLSQPAASPAAEPLASQPLPRPVAEQLAALPYTFADELEPAETESTHGGRTSSRAGNAGAIEPLRLGGAALHPHRNSQALPPIASSMPGATGGATLRPNRNSGTGSSGATDPAAGNPPAELPGDGDSPPDQSPPLLENDPLPPLPGTPDGSQPPAAEVPEPSSLALLAAGLLVLGALRRRQR